MTSIAKPARDYLALAALLFALVATASAEYELARAVGFNQWVAAAVPGALDIYTVRAMRARRDVVVVVAAMIAVNALSHLVAAGILAVSWPLVVAVSAIAPLVLWRVHRLADHVDTPAAEQVDTRTAPAVDPVSTPVYVDTAPLSTPPAEITAPPASEQVGSVDTPEPATAPPPVEVNAEPVEVDNPRLSTEDARKIIEAGWGEGRSARSVAVDATRHHSYVTRVYRELDDAQAAEPAPLSLVKEEATA